MRLLSPSRHTRLNEAVGLLLFLFGLAVSLSLVSYSSSDPSWNTATGVTRTHNLLGLFGARWADLLLQIFGISVFLLPIHIWGLGWKWVRSSPIESPTIRVLGSLALWFSISTACGLIPHTWLIGGAIRPSGIVGMVISEFLLSRFEVAGAAIMTAAAGIVALYFASTFEMAALARWLRGPIAKWNEWVARWRAAREERRREAMERARIRAEERSARRTGQQTKPGKSRPVPAGGESLETDSRPLPAEALEQTASSEADDEEIPIRTLEYQPPTRNQPEVVAAAPEEEDDEPPFDLDEEPAPSKRLPKRRRFYKLPSSDLLNEVPAGTGYDSQELKEIASRIKSKLEEFNVRGSVVQINPGPVVTTFEFKPEAGVKYSRITTLTEDLCLGLQAESVLIERLPGKPTVGIEVPNTRREVISLRAILESDEFHDSPSKMTIALGKDINGRIKVASLETMPHLLIAGSTGSGKSVMLNAMIMSFLYKATPDEVRMIMVDPKRVELGMYEGIPHLLTPVITEPKKATNALRNAVLEMERRLKLLASHGVRNIDQYNRKMAQLRQEPRGLFDEAEEDENLRPLPYVLILIDELADLMMLERANVEECITRLAQMARAVGMHLVLATQRPSVDVITGLIKANFPSRISFRVATRVDSRTVLDSMGAEHLLGRGDMLFLPPGSSRLTRVHGAFVTETETIRVVDFWKEQAAPEYDESYLLTPPSEEEEAEEDAEVFDGEQDPMYEDAVRVVVEMGKASTSTLQRRLRLGYGRAARILDMMQRDGIIGPPDGSKPRELLKRPDWLREIEGTLR
ncbi:MAG: DNA translocase FtsK 4TM domain-containing protein [Acidobacteriaceae bacterium]|nr:DNA translocase FtsK 4TM domain-containing protein [Acidobacteriaceae bacterium]